jgi:purine-binding chemotaxis protein CheW
MSRDRGSGAGDSRKYLSFFLGDEKYAIEILKVREILSLVPVTPVPGMSDGVEGVINLRGRIVPVVDLRARFGMPGFEPDPDTCIIVVEADSRGQTVHVGCVVDRVHEVMSIQRSQVETPPRGSKLHAEYVLGLAKTGDSVLVLLDIEWLVADVGVVEPADS